MTDKINYGFHSYTLPKDYFEPQVKATELRLGNWLESYMMWNDGLKNSVSEIKPIRHFQVDVETLKMIEKDPLLVTMKPIPLTPEILEKCGFEKCFIHPSEQLIWYEFPISNDGFKFHFQWFSAAKKWHQFKIIGNGCYDESGEKDITNICENLHQLQNIYFALTGQELNYKQ